MKSHPLASQESQTGNSTPPANAAIYRRVRTATGCAFLATAVITSVCIFITALPLLPVLLVGITICTALASVFFWSIYRLKKQETSPKPEILKNEEPPVAITGKENPQDGASETPGPRTRFEGEKPRVETSEQKKILDDPEPPSEPPASGEESPQPPIDPKEFQILLQTTMVHQNFDTLEQGVNENAMAVKMQAVMDVNNPKIAGQLSAAQALYFLGMEDNNFIFECSQTTDKPDPKIRFLANNIEDVWGKSRNVKSLYFSGKLPENFLVSGNKLQNLECVTFSLNEIGEIETAKHLTGTFNSLRIITFRNCNNLYSARIRDNCIAEKLELVQFDNCPLLDEVHIGNEPPTQIGDIAASETNSFGNPIVQRAHIHPGSRFLFRSTKRVLVLLDKCKNLLAKQTYSDIVYVRYTEVYVNRIEYFKTPIERCKVCGILEQKENLQRSDKTSTISLQLPGVACGTIALRDLFLDPHVIMNLDLAKYTEYKYVTLPIYDATVKHLEFTKPMNDCFVSFDADPNGTLLDINPFPQNSTTDIGVPFKMSFRTYKNSSKLPNIKVNGSELDDITWYRSADRFPSLIPVTRGNLGKANTQGLTPLEEGAAWGKNETVELNSVFLIAAAES